MGSKIGQIVKWHCAQGMEGYLGPDGQLPLMGKFPQGLRMERPRWGPLSFPTKDFKSCLFGNPRGERGELEHSIILSQPPLLPILPNSDPCGLRETITN